VPFWKEFIEITQRRNLLVHCKGCVSEQYIQKCKDVGINQLPCKGDNLTVDENYFNKAYYIFYVMGVLLSQVVTRHLLRKENVLGEIDNLELLKTQNLIQEVPTTFTYANYVNADNVTFVQSNDSATTINITTDSIATSDEVKTKFYYPKTVTLTNTSANEEIESAFSTYETNIHEPKVEIVNGDYSYSTTDLTMTSSELKAELNKIINPEKPPVTDDETNKEDNKNNPSDEIKDGIEDIKNDLNEFKEELKKSKSLQTVTAILSIILSIGLFYLIYLAVKKIIKWFQKR
jgi:hypothetical protein